MSNRSYRVKYVDRFTEREVVYENDHCQCVMKLFPTCHHKRDIGEEDYRRFHLRFYLPKEYLADAQRRIERVIVMTNGLDEINHYTLYDELGTRLASRGLAAVLLPLPDHLNRHTRYRMRNPTVAQLSDRPSEILMREPQMLYRRYIQFRDELELLLSHIKGDNCKHGESECFFYHSLFSPNTRVSFLGYSLGGSAMLTNFLERCGEDDSLSSCILLSGAIDLRNINPERLFSEKNWDIYVEALENEYSEHQVKEKRKKYKNANRLFAQVFFGHNTAKIKTVLQEHARRVLFLFGGRDRVISYERLKEISPKRWGLGFFVLPGINHFLAIDEEWKKWVNLVVNLIVDFEENAVRKVITQRESMRQWQVLQQRKVKKKAEVREAHHLVTRSLILNWDPAQLARSETEKREAKRFKRTALLKELKSIRNEDEQLGRTQRRDHAQTLKQIRLGELLYILELIDFEDLVDALDQQVQLAGLNRKERIGDILVERLGALRRDIVENLANAIDVATNRK